MLSQIEELDGGGDLYSDFAIWKEREQRTGRLKTDIVNDEEFDKMIYFTPEALEAVECARSWINHRFQMPIGGIDVSQWESLECSPDNFSTVARKHLEVKSREGQNKNANKAGNEIIVRDVSAINYRGSPVISQAPNNKSSINTGNQQQFPTFNLPSSAYPPLPAARIENPSPLIFPTELDDGKSVLSGWSQKLLLAHAAKSKKTTFSSPKRGRIMPKVKLDMSAIISGSDIGSSKKKGNFYPPKRKTNDHHKGVSASEIVSQSVFKAGNKVIDSNIVKYKSLVHRRISIDDMTIFSEEEERNGCVFSMLGRGKVPLKAENSDKRRGKTKLSSHFPNNPISRRGVRVTSTTNDQIRHHLKKFPSSQQIVPLPPASESKMPPTEVEPKSQIYPSLPFPPQGSNRKIKYRRPKVIQRRDEAEDRKDAFNLCVRHITPVEATPSPQFTVDSKFFDDRSVIAITTPTSDDEQRSAKSSIVDGHNLPKNILVEENDINYIESLHSKPPDGPDNIRQNHAGQSPLAFSTTVDKNKKGNVPSKAQSNNCRYSTNVSHLLPILESNSRDFDINQNRNIVDQRIDDESPVCVDQLVHVQKNSCGQNRVKNEKKDKIEPPSSDSAYLFDLRTITGNGSESCSNHLDEQHHENLSNISLEQKSADFSLTRELRSSPLSSPFENYVHPTNNFNEYVTVNTVKPTPIGNISYSTILIQTAARRFLARRETLIRMCALMALQAIFRRWISTQALHRSKAAAVQIQAAFRGWWIRVWLQVDAYYATSIQRAIRGYIARCTYRLHLNDIILVQSTFRMNLGIDRSALRMFSLILIQSYYRGYAVRRNVRRWLDSRRTFLVRNKSTIEKRKQQSAIASLRHMQVNAAVVIQAFFRGHWSRLWLKIDIYCAIIIQKYARRFVALREKQGDLCKIVRVQSVVRQFIAIDKASLRLYSIVLIEARCRGYIVRKNLSEGFTNLQEKATLIQKMWRAYTQQYQFQVVIVDIIIAQSVIRCYLAKRLFRRRQTKQRRAYMRQINTAAQIIQANWRCFNTQYHYDITVIDIIIAQSVIRRFLVLSRVRKKLWIRKRVRWAAITIQTRWRSYSCFIMVIKSLVDILIVQTVARRWLAVRHVNACRMYRRIQYEHNFVITTQTGGIRAMRRNRLSPPSKPRTSSRSYH